MNASGDREIPSGDFRTMTAAIESAWEQLPPGGALHGETYRDSWDWNGDFNKGKLLGVRSAVDSFARRHDRLVIQPSAGAWEIRKPLTPISPSEIAVVSASTLDLPWRKAVAENHARYCEARGYRYLHETLEPGPRPPHWCKMGIVRRQLETSRFVLWQDADAIFQRFDLTLSRFWDGIEPMVFFADRERGIYAGTFLARAGRKTIEFLTAWENADGFDEHPAQDNAALTALWRCGRAPGLIVPNRLACSFPHLGPGDWQPEDFVAHVSALETSARFNFLLDLLARERLYG